MGTQKEPEKKVAFAAAHRRGMSAYNPRDNVNAKNPFRSRWQRRAFYDGWMAEKEWQELFLPNNGKGRD